ncbi:MAG: hypothetical protein KGH64_00590 [Candidatus Micrarchaeota archaeon]|nr:hypothetical protein [Candidatus Micrarchaeota archaeon]
MKYLSEKEIEPGSTLYGKVVKKWHAVVTGPVPVSFGEEHRPVCVEFTDGSQILVMKTRKV